MSRITFFGLLGHNCGAVVPYAGADKRIDEKGFNVVNGIPTLRGYARISDLATASTTKYDEYQRTLKEEHVKEISEFLDNCKEEAKFLPEVVLSVNNRQEVSLNRYDHRSFSSLSKTAMGAIKNIEYYALEVEEASLTRVDGNHRLEAGKDKDYYVPFSIVLWNTDIDDQGNAFLTNASEESTESEAFLFYILNSTARKLEAEDNFKGLVKSIKWSNDELSLINRYLPLLRYYYKNYSNISLASSEFVKQPLSQICEVLEEISDINNDIDEVGFCALVEDSYRIIGQIEEFDYIKREFPEIFFQLSFYARYKSSDLLETIHILQLIDRWLEKYKYTGVVFSKASKIFEVAYKYITVSPKYVFMAMQYKSEEAVRDYNGALKRSVDALNNMGSEVEIIAYPIMTGEGKSINITSDIYEKIENCSVFIADTTEANPNVMYELGIAYCKKKPIIMVREKSQERMIPSDIISEYYYDFCGMAELEELLIRHIRVIMKNDYGIVYTG